MGEYVNSLASPLSALPSSRLRFITLFGTGLVVSESGVVFVVGWPDALSPGGEHNCAWFLIIVEVDPDAGAATVTSEQSGSPLSPGSPDGESSE